MQTITLKLKQKNERVYDIKLGRKLFARVENPYPPSSSIVKWEYTLNPKASCSLYFTADNFENALERVKKAYLQFLGGLGFDNVNIEII